MSPAFARIKGPDCKPGDPPPAPAVPDRLSPLIAALAMTKITTDAKDAKLAWISWKTLERHGYKVRFINPARLHG